MVDIQSATAKNRGGKKKKEERRDPAAKYNDLPYRGGHKQQRNDIRLVVFFFRESINWNSELVDK